MKKTLQMTLVFMFSLMLTNAQDITLPEVNKTGGMPLMEALNQRHSSREFSSRELPLQTLADLLWAAYGINRPEASKRTVPSSQNFQEIEVYVALKSGFYRYVAKKNLLLQIHKNDIRANTGKQDFVATAPFNLIYVANSSKLPENIDMDTYLKTSYANAGFIVQNVYLYCASEGLNVVVRGYFDSDELAKAMKLPKTHQIILTQTVGFPVIN
ncbi:MAG: nitroreductase [Bacteroidetes bacterium HGW-Bacteroidetes-4]|jgi:SagB-type dehydrogenase family enzyme|nr:MAG: nitroreductase [Bacteroidetes bacterium HGW-Bacteroidetes-4]